MKAYQKKEWNENEWINLKRIKKRGQNLVIIDTTFNISYISYMGLQK